MDSDGIHAGNGQRDWYWMFPARSVRRWQMESIRYSIKSLWAQGLSITGTLILPIYIVHPKVLRQSPQRKTEPERDWETRRIREVAFADGDPLVVIIGAGHTGLQVAARLRNLGVMSLILEKTPRVGDNVGLLHV